MVGLTNKIEKLNIFIKLLFSHRMGLAGFSVICLFVLMAFFASFLGTVDPDRTGAVENILKSPSSRILVWDRRSGQRHLEPDHISDPGFP